MIRPVHLHCILIAAPSTCRDEVAMRCRQHAMASVADIHVTSAIRHYAMTQYITVKCKKKVPKTKATRNKNSQGKKTQAATSSAARTFNKNRQKKNTDKQTSCKQPRPSTNHTSAWPRRCQCLRDELVHLSKTSHDICDKKKHRFTPIWDNQMHARFLMRRFDPKHVNEARGHTEAASSEPRPAR